MIYPDEALDAKIFGLSFNVDVALKQVAEKIHLSNQPRTALVAAGGPNYQDSWWFDAVDTYVADELLDGIEEMYSQIKLRRGGPVGDYVDTTQDIFNAHLRNVRLYTDTIAAEALDAIAEGALRGDTLDAIVERMMESGALSSQRASVIASTELSGARNASVLKILSQAGNETVRWVTASDGNVRDTHKAVGGTIKNTGGLFVVGGYTAQYPGDHALPAEERVRCRCRLEPITIAGSTE